MGFIPSLSTMEYNDNIETEHDIVLADGPMSTQMLLTWHSSDHLNVIWTDGAAHVRKEQDGKNST